ncbi:unnamed protein product [Bursaphelenchus xylophilus]|uniref:(pine wood nematode) hypothetical protein n=1 Tax=Bursaphelenchus xylophilus TaxID=6326 RepID=A0A1I7RXH9_BURXY|nr:unnamed protein product [Bursaphelenchus xylophilus]CAG9126441.1 unnamed protein product [Bursaphelenchus xylophilus]
MGILMDESELPSEQFMTFYKRFEYVSYSITLVVVLGTMWIMIISSPKSLSKYRWFLINELAWSLSFDTFAALIGGVVLYPIPCYYGENIASHLPSEYVQVYVMCGIASIVSKVTAIAFQFEHRYSQCLLGNSSYRAFCLNLRGKAQLAIRVIISLVLGISAVLPFLLLNPDQDEAKSRLSAVDPVLAKVFQEHPTAACFAYGTSASKALIPEVFILAGFMALGMLVMCAMYNLIQRRCFSPHTYRLQMMLFKSLVAQTSVLVLFLLGPVMVFVVLPIAGVRNLPKYTMYGFLLLLVHTPLDCIIILYFIKPYRLILLKNLSIIHLRLPTSSILTTSTRVHAVKPHLTPS